jgi:L-arabinonolactonase
MSSGTDEKELPMGLATLAVDSRCALGEGILWCEQRAVLFWTDIEGARLWMHTPDSGATRSWPLPDRLACLALGRERHLLLGLAKGLYVVDIDAAIANSNDKSNDTALPLKHVADVEADNPETRLNDGRADRQGNFVFGTKSERADGAAIGSFYQYSPDHGLRRLALPNAAIPNSICFSPDGATMYYCDSPQRRILCCDYGASTATVSGQRVFAVLDHPSAEPDGSIIDADGGLWNAQWGGGQVVRYRPDGSVDRTIAVPANQPSCCTIGGAGYDRLYITSARTGLDDTALAAFPHSGGIFQCSLQSPLGLPESRVEIP